ncbi:MAG: GntR family transcriptional regulator [Pseudomonadota bacterium]
MPNVIPLMERRTTTDLVFDHLYREIVSLTRLPGTKLSEADIARHFGVSRQPVRDAFNRLGNLDLLLIRPQRATEVRGFSMRQIARARFVRLAVELEVITHACALWNRDHTAALEQNLQQQQQAIRAGKTETFHTLDYGFHRLICDLGGCSDAFETIEQCKQKLDRLCALSLGKDREVETLYKDHCDLTRALDHREDEAARATIRRHLGRLDSTIADIQETHAEYFE